MLLAAKQLRITGRRIIPMLMQMVFDKENKALGMEKLTDLGLQVGNSLGGLKTVTLIVLILGKRWLYFHLL
jgi:hypothetical protein